jgi:hypothetical protein
MNASRASFDGAPQAAVALGGTVFITKGFCDRSGPLVLVKKYVHC